MSPHENRIRTTKTNWKPKRKPEERTSNRNEFKLINLALCVGMIIPGSTRHCIITRSWKIKNFTSSY